MHAARFVHRDLKPDNLVRTPDGRVVILDLGLARKLPTDPDDPTRANVQVGSLEYMPPEQLVDSATVDERADLYAFGCVLYELCAGRPPFVGDAAALERAHAALRPPRLGALAHGAGRGRGARRTIASRSSPRAGPRRVAEVRERLARVARRAHAAASMQHSVSVIREGKQPVVLLWAELPRVDRALLGDARRRAGSCVASQRGRRVLAGVLGGEHADPASDRDRGGARSRRGRRARRAAPRCAARRRRPAARRRCTASRSRSRRRGCRPATWTGVVLTRALATVTQAPTRPADGSARAFARSATARQAIELFGRDAC